MFNSFLEVNDIPNNGKVLARISDNVLDEEDWTPFEIEIKDGVVVRVDNDDPYYLSMVGWTTTELAKWTQYDSTGQHPEAYHELSVIDNYDMCPDCGMSNGDHIMACSSLTDEMWNRR